MNFLLQELLHLETALGEGGDDREYCAEFCNSVVLGWLVCLLSLL